MNSERWQQVENLYHSALELGADERDDFLSVACAGDEALRRDVLSLLASTGSADGFLSEPALSLGFELMRGEFRSRVGQTVGRYKLLELLGRGGMGEVYLAHDPRLNRRVALKLLPAELGDDPARNLRFEQEARAASAISHPNVAHVYEIGEDSGLRYITMEYVAGTTLRKTMTRGPMEVGAALDIAGQIAEALAAAHAEGVVHRDVKPENVMLRPDGYVKVLDFGLAKLVESGTRVADLEHAPPSLHTGPEFLMGTSDYMSPEQMRRHPVDERTDIWSLGVVLYEMLAGNRPFAGKDQIVVAVLELEPAPLGDVRPGLPGALCDIVARALRKRPEERPASARKMAEELRRLRRTLEDSPSPTPPTPPGTTPEPDAADPAGGEPDGESARPYGALGRISERWRTLLTAPVPRVRARRWGPMHWAALLMLVGLVIPLGVMRLRPLPLQARPLNLRFERLSLSGGIRDIVLSPDGEYVASVIEDGGRHAIHVAELATSSDLRVTPPADGVYSGLSFSPDGNYIYYLESRASVGTLYRVSKLGGGQRKILDGVNTPIAFSPDGGRMAFVRSNAEANSADLMVARADGGSERLLTRLAGEDSFVVDVTRAGPSWSPDGKTIACPSINRSQGGPRMNLQVVDAGSGAPRRLNADSWREISRIVWLADGSGLAVAASRSAGSPWQLELVAFPGGEARPVTNDPNNYGRVSSTRDSGLFLTLNIEESSSIWQLAAGDTLRSTLAVEERKGLSAVSSLEGGRLVYAASKGSHTNISVTDPGGGPDRQLTFESDNFRPVVSPDGRHIVFVSKRAGAANIWRMDADGGRPTRLTSGPYEDMPAVTPDGWVIYRTGRGVRKVSLQGGEPVKLFEANALCPTVSPDGRLLAYFVTDEPGTQKWRVEVYDLARGEVVKSFDLPDATNTFSKLRWTPDGKGLNFISSADGASNIWLQPLGGGLPRKLTDFRDAEIVSFDWAADGGRLVCVRETKAYIPLLVRLF
jgi:serine/threonine protein kinase/Tol biopolymer transport system component